MQDKTTRMGVRAWAEPTPHRVALPASVAPSGLLPLWLAEPPGRGPRQQPGPVRPMLGFPCPVRPMLGFPCLCVLWGSKSTGGFQSHAASLPVICSLRTAQQLGQSTSLL